MQYGGILLFSAFCLVACCHTLLLHPCVPPPPPTPCRQAKFTEQSRIKSGLLMVFNGALTAAAAFAVGHGIDAAVDAKVCDI